MKKKMYNVTMLKALSLIAVSTYHLLSHRLSGGFLGVIIFMIISGFFLERASVKSSGEVDIRVYLKRIKARILKIMSPLWTIVAISLLFALVFSREIFDDSILSSISTIFAVENIRAIVKGISYFDRSGNFNLFTHLWYISVYIQVVIIYYLIDYLINKFDLKDKRLTIFAAGTLISTMISYYLSFTKAPVIRIYYGTDTRISAFF
ncbi:MAG: acyltransferase, partial [Anaerococcus prevotii]|nr:acyltransferase [Anaerococcus prevotii]